nr:MAG TPA: hypothetical protein [Caudoviricetes sp.]
MGITRYCFCNKRLNTILVGVITTVRRRHSNKARITKTAKKSALSH